MPDKKELREHAPMLDVWIGDTITLTIEYPVDPTTKEPVDEDFSDPEMVEKELTGKVTYLRSVNKLFDPYFKVRLLVEGLGTVHLKVPRTHKPITLN